MSNFGFAAMEVERDDMRAQLLIANTAVAAVTKERDDGLRALRLAGIQIADLSAENARLRAAIEPTAETMAHIRAALRYMANWSDPLIEAILAAIAARAGVKL